MIVLVLLLGVAYTFRMVSGLWPEVNSVNSFRISRSRNWRYPTSRRCWRRWQRSIAPNQSG